MSKVSSGWRMATLGVAILAVFGIGLASAGVFENRSNEDEYVETEVLPVTTVPTTAEISDLNGGFPCPLIGRSAAEALSYLSGLGFDVEWGFESPTSAEGDGHRSTPQSVPLDSIVMDVSPLDADTVVVGVHAADDRTHNTPAPKRDKDC